MRVNGDRTGVLEKSSMRIIEINHAPSTRQLRIFGCICGALLGTLGALLIRADVSPVVVALIWTAAATVLLITSCCPAVLRPASIGMAYTFLPIGIAVSFLMIAFLYYLVITPIGIILRCLGHDTMSRNFDSHADSYWIPRRHDDDSRRPFRQF